MENIKLNWFKFFINESPEISSSISRGDIDDLPQYLWNVLFSSRIDIMDAREVMIVYATYSLKGKVIQGMPPILPRRVCAMILNGMISPNLADPEWFDGGDVAEYFNGGKTP
jgi:hypothetical protein